MIGGSRRPEDRDALVRVGTEAVAALIISIAVVEGALKALSIFLVQPEVGDAAARQQDAKEVGRLKLGRWLALVLEFELAADILRTAVAPTWTEIGHSRPSRRFGRR